MSIFDFENYKGIHLDRKLHHEKALNELSNQDMKSDLIKNKTNNLVSLMNEKVE